MRSQELLIFRQFCKPLRNFVTKTFQSCSQRVPVMEGGGEGEGEGEGGGVLQGLDFFDL